MDHELGQELRPVRYLYRISGCSAVGILIEFAGHIQAKPFDFALIESPGISGTQLCTLDIGLANIAGAQVHIFFDPLEVQFQLEPSIRISFEFKGMHARIIIRSSLIGGKAAGAAQIIDVFKIKEVVHGKVPVEVICGVYSGEIKSDLRILEDVFLNSYY